MTTKVVPGQLVAVRDSAELAREAATRIGRALRSALGRGARASIALSGGNTPRDTYVQLAREPGIDWSAVDVFWVDERAVGPTDDRSNFRWAKASLLDVVPIPADHVHRMRAEPSAGGQAAPPSGGPADYLEAAARDYEATLRAHVALDVDGVPTFDAIVLGVGDDGHTASLFPGEPTVDIHDRFVAAVPARGGREARLTLTVPVIERGRHVFILAVGAAKRPALERAWAVPGDIHQTPARVVRGCRGAVTWLIDKPAGGLDEQAGSSGR
jgi:6-phosphogluconolactonase